jgi:hypothetical protein
MAMRAAHSRVIAAPVTVFGMTIHDRSTDGYRAPDPLPAFDDRTVIDVYPVAPGTGGPPEWAPPPTNTAEPTAGGGKHRAKLAVAGALVAAEAPAGGGGQGFGGGRGGGPGAGGGGTAAALHSTAVVSDGSGAYVTQETQTGTVSAVDGDTATATTLVDAATTGQQGGRPQDAQPGGTVQDGSGTGT